MTHIEKKFYRVKEVCAILNISRATLWRRIAAGTMPTLERFNARIAGYANNTLKALQADETNSCVNETISPETLPEKHV